MRRIHPRRSHPSIALVERCRAPDARSAFPGVGVLLFAVLLIPSGSSAQVRKGEAANVLLLNSYHQGYVWSDDEEAAIKAEVRHLHPNTRFQSIRFDSKRHPRSDDSYYLDRFREWRSTHGDVAVDVVVCIDETSFKMWNNGGAEAMPDTPMVFCGVTDPALDLHAEKLRNATGVPERPAVADNVQLIMRMLPDTTTIVFIADNSTFGRMLEDYVRKEIERLKQLHPDLQATFLSGNELTTEQMLDEVAELDSGAVVLTSIWCRGRDDVFIDPNKCVQEMTSRARVPVFGLYAELLQDGIVGGKLISGKEQGRIAGKMLSLVLQGRDVDSMPVISYDLSQYMFSGMELARWGIGTSDLPENSEVEYSTGAFFLLYWRVMLGGVVFLILQTMLLLGLSYFHWLYRRAADRLREREQEISLLFESMPIGCAVFEEEAVSDSDGETCNLRLVRANMPFRGLVFGEDCDVAPGVDCTRKLRLRTPGLLAAVRNMTRTNDHEVIYGIREEVEGRLLDITCYLPDEESVAVLATDVTEREEAIRSREKAEEEMRRTMGMLETAQDIAELGYWVFNTETRETVVSNRVCELFGYDSERFQSDYPPPYLAAIHEYDRKMTQALRSQAIRDDKPISTMYRVPLKDGSMRYIFERSNMLLTPDEPWRIGIIQDVTLLEEMKQESRRQRKVFELLIESMPLGVVLVDTNRDNRIVVWNQAMADISGIERHDAIGESLDSQLVGGVYYSDDSEEIPLEDILDRGLYRRQKDSAEWQIYTSRLVGNLEEGNVLMVVDDVTAQRDLELQLRHAQRLESIGQLAAGIAHEINTPMQYIEGNLCFLNDMFEELLASQGGEEATSEEEHEDLDMDFVREQSSKAIDQSLEGVSCVREIVKAMKNFSHPGKQATTRVDVNAAISDTVIVSRAEWKYVADVDLDLADGLPQAFCVGNELTQALLNVIVNAAHAIEASEKDGMGRIGISTRAVDESIEILISDTGDGVPAEIRDRIFDPFFTTKEVGRGTGQGLAIVHNVVAASGGTVSFETEDGVGTTFRIRLPIQPSRASNGFDTSDEEAAPAMSTTSASVEDGQGE